MSAEPFDPTRKHICVPRDRSPNDEVRHAASHIGLVDLPSTVHSDDQASTGQYLDIVHIQDGSYDVGKVQRQLDRSAPRVGGLA